jgi:membrane-associated protease RseP (regulator of RpoE activity)
MRRLFSFLLLAAVAVPAAAQVTPRPPREHRDTTRAHRDTTRAFGYMYQYGPEGATFQAFRRGRLGVLVDLSADPARDSIGARVAGVTPGGPADKAGVHEGDIIVRMNGTALAGAAGRREGEAESDRSRPGTRLIELASRLDTGDTVRLEFRRDNQPRTVTLVAGESGLENMVQRFRMTMPERGATRMKIPGGDMLFSFTGAPLANLELVKVNPGLAEYFGTSEGVLVVSAPEDSSLALKSGDVILSIGGRRPTTPAQAMRILGTYEANESVSFEVMRMKRRITVSGKMPEGRGWRVMRNSFDFDLPLMELMPRLEHLPELPRMMLPRHPLQAAPLRLIKHVET